MSNRANEDRLAFVGGGQIAEALIAGALSGGVYEADHIYAADPDTRRVDHLKQKYGVLAGTSNRDAVIHGSLVVLAVKPQMLDAVLREIGGDLVEKLVVSVVAGASIRRVVDTCSRPVRVVRAMPNTPALVQEGMTALAFGPDVKQEEMARVRGLFESVGRVVPVEERLMDAVTGLSGSGPAYVFLAIEALADGGVKMGLPRETACLLAAQTVLGAARMVLQTGQHPARLKDQVASPGGTTIAGLHQLEQGGLRATLIDAIEAAAKRSQELGR